MGDLIRCASCGLPLEPGAPAGLCPACLIRLAFSSDQSQTVEAQPSDAALVGTTAGVRAAARNMSAPPVRIGPYRLIRQVGEGGMGVVYLAEQDEPIRRTVALKLIKAGMDTAEVVSRFEAERQTLALMDHPNIAHVYDAGASVEGRPYFVMEYVPGLPITDYCDRHGLSTRQRIELVVEVCGAIQHAHQKGTIHRDLKPSNILVAEQEGRAVPKVIDFGIAKATDQRSVERAYFTQRGRLVGTPEYMSPEQADPGAGGIDTRTDIYAMGVILYELLVGELPFPAERLRQAAYTELLRILREEDPPKPSTRVTSSSPSTLAGRRRTGLPGLVSELKRDLDWITLKALEKDRARRYASASEFAADLSRSLANEPVTARPQSVAYRTAKFVRRNRLAVSAAAMILVAIVSGLVLSLNLYGRAEAARHDADAQRVEADRQRQDALVGRREAEAASGRADAARVDADGQRTVATDALRQAEEELYFNSINLAAREWAEGNISLVDRILARAPDRLRNWEWRFLASVNHQERAAFKAGTAGVQTLSFSSDGARLVTVGPDRIVSVWDVSTRRRLSTFSYREANDIRGGPLLSPDGQRLLIQAGQGRADVLDTTDGRRLYSVESAGKVLFQSAFSPNGSLLAANLVPHPPTDKTSISVLAGEIVIQLWDARTGRPLRELSGVRTGGLHFSPDSRWLVVDSGQSVHVVDCADGTVSDSAPGIRPGGPGLPVPNPAVNGVWYRHLGRLGGSDRAVVQQSGRVAALAIASQTSTDRTIQLRRPDGTELWSWNPPPEQAINRWGFSPDRSTMAMTLQDRSIRIVDTLSGRSLSRLVGSAQALGPFAFSADGRRLASTEVDGTVRIWDIQSSATRVTTALTAPDSFRPANRWLAISPDQNQLLLGTGIINIQNRFHSWNLTTSRLGFEWLAATDQQVLPGGPGFAAYPSYDPSGKRLLVPGMLYAKRDDGSIAGRYRLTVLDASSGAVATTFGPQLPGLRVVADLATLKGEAVRDYAAAYGPAWSADGRRIVVSRIDLKSGTTGAGPPVFESACRTEVWDARTGTLILSRSLSIRPMYVCGDSALLSNNEGILQFTRFWADAHSTVRLVDLSASRIRWHREDLEFPVFPTFVVSADDQRMAVADDDRSVVILDVTTGRTLATLGPLPSPARAIAFSPDGTRVATLGATGDVRLWDATSGRFLLTMPDHESAMRVISWTLPTPLSSMPTRLGLSFSPDGRQLFVTRPVEPLSERRIERKTWVSASR
jgi:serine/threonine protein kinase/WD40 repeat protein